MSVGLGPTRNLGSRPRGVYKARDVMPYCFPPEQAAARPCTRTVLVSLLPLASL
jgi:hypothetical protein